MMRMQALALALALAGLTAASSVQACPLQTPDIEQAGLALDWMPAQPLVMGEHFALEIVVCPATAELTRADAIMPAHRHGMNYRPSIVRHGNGRWRAEGYLFHMSGDWELLFDVRSGDRSERLRAKVQVP